MKIDFALMSCDENPFFHDFIPVITAAWNKLGIKPVFGIITTGETDRPIDLGDRIEFHFKYIDDPKINYADPARKQLYQAEMLRIWLWKHLYKNGYTGNGIFSDIDMMPLSKQYFQGIADQYSDDKFVSYCTDAKLRFGQIASCYNLASCKFVSYLLEQESWYDFACWASENCGPTHGADQWVMEWLLNKAGDKGVSLTRGFKEENGQAHNRLDRDDWRYSDDQVGKQIFDAHLLRPYSQHKQAIDKLLSLIP